MTMHEEWTDKLSDYLDDELSAEERAAVESHLRDCKPCTAVLNDLKRVVARARTLDPRPPQVDLWDGIRSRIARDRPLALFGRRAPRRFSFTVPELAAAAVLLIAISGGVVWQLAARSGQQARAAVTAATPNREASLERSESSADAFVAPVGLADAQYDAAVADLEKALKSGRGRLDATTIAIVEHNLEIIDRAIDQARQALESDPANSYLSSHLVEARRHKLDLLRRATALTNETD
jgi:anti-sigma factor RsiW